MIIFSHAKAIAQSVPARIWSHISAFEAIGEKYGSIEINFAPFFQPSINSFPILPTLACVIPVPQSTMHLALAGSAITGYHP